jgi:hypothetical protein
VILIFLIGVQLGLLAGAMLCIRYLRREVAADIGPRLKRIETQLENLEAATNLALMTQYAELSERLHHEPAPPAPRSALP